MILAEMGALIAQTSGRHGGWLTQHLLELARGGAEWVLWLLVLMLIVTFVVFFERLVFLRRVRADGDAMRAALAGALETGEIDALLESWTEDPSMEARVLRYGLRDAARGPDAVLALCAGAIGTERLRYEKRLSFLATVGSNAPFVGLFGTVMGIILAFDQLQGTAGAAGSNMAVMGVLAEALIATGMGLLAAIPAIVFFNILKRRITRTVTQTKLLAQTAAAFLRERDDAEPPHENV